MSGLRDMTFIRNSGRPRWRGDPFESFFRTHILQQSRLASPVFSAVYEEARRGLRRRPAEQRDELLELADTWEERHAGDCFYAGSLILPELALEWETRHRGVCFFAGSLILRQAARAHVEAEPACLVAE